MPVRRGVKLPGGGVVLKVSASRRAGEAMQDGNPKARVLYEVEMSLIDEGVASSLVYDEEHDLFRFPDGRFAFDQRRADVELLWRRGYLG
jgi:hypothetical protein